MSSEATETMQTVETIEAVSQSASSPASTAGAGVAPGSADPTHVDLTKVAPAQGGVLGGREQIDAVDAQIVALIQRRIDISRQIQAARLTDGGRRVDLRRETEIIGRYSIALGRPGTTVAMALLELGRGRA